MRGNVEIRICGCMHSGRAVVAHVIGQVLVHQRFFAAKAKRSPLAVVPHWKNKYIGTLALFICVQCIIIAEA